MKKVNFLNPLSYYGYIEQKYFDAADFCCNNIEVSQDDQIISVTEDGELLGVVKLDIKNNQLSLIGKNGNTFSTIDLPIVDVIKNAYYDEATNSLVIIVGLCDGTTKEIIVPFNDLLNDYVKQSDFNQLVDTVNQLSKDVETKYYELSNNISGNTNRIIKLESMINSESAALEEEIKARQEADKELDNKITTVNNNLVEAINNYNNVILPQIVNNINQSIMNETNARIEGDNDLLTKIDELREQTNSSINSINQTFNEFKDSVNMSLDTINDLNDEQSARLDKLEAAIGDGVVSNDELEAAIKVETDRALMAEENLRKLVSQTYNALETMVKDLEQNLNDLDAKYEKEFTSIREEISKISSDINVSLEDIQNSINAINASIEEINSTIQNLSNDLTALIEAEKERAMEAEKDLLSQIESLNTSLSEEAKAREAADELLTKQLSNKVDWVTLEEKSKNVRKGIILANHDTILGTTTSGGTANLVMLSKWDKADFGSASIELNLNGSAVHPTYNDKDELAFVSDIATEMAKISLVKEEDGSYTLYVGEEVAGTISIPKDKFLKSVTYNEPTQELVFVFETEEGEQTTRIDLTELVDTYLAGNGLELDSDNRFNVIVDNESESYITVTNKGIKISGVNKAISDAEARVDEKLNEKVDWVDINTEDNPNRKAILLQNHDMILGKDTAGTAYNIAMISKWGIVDLGTTKLPLNLNVPSGVRPTVQEEGQTGETANKIAYLSDIEKNTSDTEALSAKLEEEIANRKAADSDIIGDESSLSSEMSLNGIKKYVDENVSNINISIEESINDYDSKLQSQLGKFITKDEATAEHNTLKSELSTEIDSKTSTAKNEAINEAVNQSTAKINEKILLLNDAISANATSITELDSRCDHFDDLFAMILDEHGDPIELNFYTKSEIDTKVEALNSKDKELNDELQKAVKYDDILDGRKAITLANHDTILGTTTSGGTANLVMLSKWDKADFGSKNVEINLNGSAVHPTYNDSEELAFVSDIQKGVYNLGEIESFNNLSALASAKGVCDEQDNVILTFKITTVPYGKESGFIVNIRNGNKISQALYWKQALEPQMYRELNIDENGDIANVEFTANSNRTLYKDSLPNQTIFTLTTESDNETIKTALSDVLHDNKPLTKEQLDDCLKYGYYLLESSMRVPVYVGWNGNSYTLTMVGLPNPKGDLVACTVSLSINDDNSVYAITRNGSRATILTSSNINNNATIIGLNSTDNLLLSRIEVLEEKLAKLAKTNVEEVSLNEGSEASFDDSTKDYIISGSETKSTSIVGKTVKLDNLSISNNARTSIKANDVELKGVTLNGEFPKNGGNSVININNAEYIVVKDMIFDSSNVYNGIEIGLSSEVLPKSILFDNCQFLGTFSNNAILIFGTQENAVININNCYFENLSNPFRLSNKQNTSCVMNITNCKIDKWDVNSPWQGMMLLQDYTSGDADKANTNNLFAPEKITINVINTIGPNNKKVTMPSDISTVCGTGDEKQLFYVWDNYRNSVPYDKSKYPTITIQ